MVSKIHEFFREICIRIGAMRTAPSANFSQALLLLVGLGLISLAMTSGAGAQEATNYDDQLLTDSINYILTYMEGTYGALIMACAGVLSVLSAAYGQYRTSICMLIVAVGSYILRSFIGTFFQDEGIMD